jgi:hypothetical protein
MGKAETLTTHNPRVGGNLLQGNWTKNIQSHHLRPIKSTCKLEGSTRVAGAKQTAANLRAVNVGNGINYIISTAIKGRKRGVYVVCQK